MKSVVVVGDLVTDILVRTAGAVAPDTDTDARVTTAGGGAAANTACWLAVAGAPTALVARVGADEAGRARSLELFAYGVDGHVATDDGQRTGTVVVLVGPDGRRSMLTDSAASANLQPTDLPVELFGADAHLHLSGYTLLHEGSREAGRQALWLARRSGMTVSVDAASAAPLARTGPAAFLDSVAGVDLLLANTDEAAVLTGQPDPVGAAEALGTWAEVAVVKAGADGAVWAGSRTGTYRCPATPAPVLDTTGAGDAFAAGLLADWLTRDATPNTALVAGAGLAARAVTVMGGRPTID
ncbi:MAG: carbohydrate kinase family protein [Propionibacteriaceae bacterium]